MPGDLWRDWPFEQPETETTTEFDAPSWSCSVSRRLSIRFAFTVVVVLC